MNPAAVIFRDAIRNMPYRLRDQGVAALEIWGIRFLISLCSTVIGAASMMPAGSFAQRILAIAGLLIFSAILGMVVVPFIYLFVCLLDSVLIQGGVYSMKAL